MTIKAQGRWNLGDPCPHCGNDVVKFNGGEPMCPKCGKYAEMSGQQAHVQHSTDPDRVATGPDGDPASAAERPGSVEADD